MLHSWVGIALTIVFLGCVFIFNFFCPEIIMEIKPSQVVFFAKSKLQPLFEMPNDDIDDDENDDDESLDENGKYIYAGATVKELKLKSVAKCQYEGRVIFELAGQEYSRPIVVSYTRKHLCTQKHFKVISIVDLNLSRG